MLWCSIDVSPLLTERLAGVVARPARLTMRLTAEGGDQTLRVLPAALAGGGFVLSPAVDSTTDLESLVGMRDARSVRARRVTRVIVSAEGTARHPFGDRFTLRVEAITFRSSR